VLTWLQQFKQSGAGFPAPLCFVYKLAAFLYHCAGIFERLTGAVDRLGAL
jgi:hypothetical protein